MPQGPFAGSHILWVHVGPHILGENPKGIPFLFIYKQENVNLIIGILRAGGIIKPSFKVSIATLFGTSHRIGLIVII